MRGRSCEAGLPRSRGCEAGPSGGAWGRRREAGPPAVRGAGPRADPAVRGAGYSWICPRRAGPVRPELPALCPDASGLPAMRAKATSARRRCDREPDMLDGSSVPNGAPRRRHVGASGAGPAIRPTGRRRSPPLGGGAARRRGAPACKTRSLLAGRLLRLGRALRCRTRSPIGQRSPAGPERASGHPGSAPPRRDPFAGPSSNEEFGMRDPETHAPRPRAGGSSKRARRRRRTRRGRSLRDRSQRVRGFGSWSSRPRLP